MSARAASIACPPLIGNNPTIADNVTSSTGCEIGSTNNDFLGADPTSFQVNVDAIFGFSDWQFAGKVIETEPGFVDIGLSATGGSNAGTWSVNDIWTHISALMLVFKGGVSKDPGNYVSYLIAEGAMSGLYVTPFKTPNGPGNAADTSHVSAYVRMGTVSDSGADTSITNTDSGGFPDTDSDTIDDLATDTDSEDVASVPEPASVLLLGGGLAMLAHAKRRKLNR